MFFNAHCISSTWDRFTVVRRRGGGDGDNDPFLLALRMRRLYVYGFFLVVSFVSVSVPFPSGARVCMRYSVRDLKIP